MHHAIEDAKGVVRGILPIALLIGYPPFGSYAGESDAYSKTYSAVSSWVKGVPHIGIFELGNEWTTQNWGSGRKENAILSGDQTLPDTWRNGPGYAVVRGVTAGAMAAIRDTEHVQATAPEPGVGLVTIYELYPNGGQKYKLFSAPGQVAAEGTIVKSWIFVHGNPSTH